MRVGYLEDGGVGFALLFAGERMPVIVHWGQPLTDPATLLSAYDALHPQRVSGALDETPWPSVLPTQAEGWTGDTRFDVRRAGIMQFCAFTVTQIDTRDHGINVHARDDEAQVAIEWTCEIDHAGLVRQRARVRNIATHDEHTQGDVPLEIGKVELGFVIPADMRELLTTTGHHLRERSPQRQPITIGRYVKETLVGRPDFDASLLLCAGEPGFGFTHGEVYATHVAWSGNALMAAERLAYTQPIIGGAEVLFGGEVALASGQSYETPWVYGAYGHGLNEVAQRFHRALREIHANWRDAHNVQYKPRPVILNTWEAVYFAHDYERLAALAERAAEVGVERFVVDDGWFGSRRDDTAGLGDWEISEEVWPAGKRSLHALAAHVHELGMEFGLWFEPEMVNPNSRMFREHPDWVLRPAPNRLPMQGRSQQVVDLTNPDAYAYVSTAMRTLVGELGIDYIKWDHNRFVTEAVSPRTGRPAVHEQTLAVYRLFEELKSAYPQLEIESCSSGGGRVDFAILSLADRIWASDCVDPVERADIQRYTSLLVPPEMIGEHVGAEHAHSTHRTTALTLRLAMAFFGHFGVEWNLLDQSHEQLDILADWIRAYKTMRDGFAGGSVWHGDDADTAVRVDGVMNAEGTHAVFRFTQLTTSATYPAAPVRLPGLDTRTLWQIRPLAVSLHDGLSGTEAGNGQSALGWWNPEGVLIDGAALESFGIRPPSLHPAHAVLFEVTRIDEAHV